MKHKLRTAIALTTLTVGSLHIANKFIITASNMKALLPMHPGRYFNWRFGKVFYRKFGSGAPLLLLHDLDSSSSSHEWNLLEQKLAENYTVYTLDLLGCGRSDKPNITYTNFLYVQLISEFTEKIIKQRTNVVATGLSTSFVIMACNNNPEIFNKLMLINPENIQKLNQIPGKRSKMTKLLMDCPVIGTSLYHILTNKEHIEYNFTEKYFFNPFKVSRRTVDIYHESAHKKESKGKYLYSSIKGNYVNINISRALKNIDNSIFILGGGSINRISSLMESYCELNPAIETAAIPDTKLLPQLEAPEEVYKLMRIFF